MALVSQRDVGTDTASFATALRQALRQDPDVILVGEMRDLETISTAVTAAETGHLVFATLHTQDAAQTIDRIVDAFPAEQQGQVRIQVASTLQGIVTQQLVPTVDGTARAVAAEVLVATPAIRNLIRDGKIHQVYPMLQAGRKFGMNTMDEHLGHARARGPHHDGSGRCCAAATSTSCTRVRRRCGQRLSGSSSRAAALGRAHRVDAARAGDGVGTTARRRLQHDPRDARAPATATLDADREPERSTVPRASAPAYSACSVIATNTTKLKRWIACQRPRPSAAHHQRRELDREEQVERDDPPARPRPVATSRRTGRRDRPSRSRRTCRTTSATRWSPTNRTVKPPRKRWRSSIHAGRGLESWRSDSSSPHTTAAVTRTHATSPLARTVYHQSCWFTEGSTLSPGSSSTRPSSCTNSPVTLCAPRRSSAPASGPATNAAFARTSAVAVLAASTVTAASPVQAGRPRAGIDAGGAAVHPRGVQARRRRVLVATAPSAEPEGPARRRASRRGRPASPAPSVASR